jgi:hypothetical protein
MKNTWRLMAGLATVAVLAVGIVVFAGNGFGVNHWGGQSQTGSASICPCEASRDADGDGIPNAQDPDWTRPLDGTGYQGDGECGCAGGLSVGYPFYGGGHATEGNGFGFGSITGCPRR